MKLSEYNRYVVSTFGFFSAINVPLLAFGQVVSGVGGALPPGVDVQALVWTVLAAGSVAVLTFGVPLPPAGRMAAALLAAVVVGSCGVFSVISPDLGFRGLPVTFLLSGIGFAVIAVGMAGTVLHPESVRERRSA